LEKSPILIYPDGPMTTFQSSARVLPRYLMDYCIPISDVTSRRHLCSARRHYLVVPQHSLSSYGCRAFAVAWNSLSNDLHDLTLSTDSFGRLLKTWLFFRSTSIYSALEVAHFMCYINSRLTQLLTQW